MASTLLSPTIITKEALRLFKNSLVFAKGANRQYDPQFANSGASPSGKIGPTLTIRKPNRYLVTDGPTLQIQDTQEESTTMTVSTRKHVDFLFSTQDLTLTVDEFAARYLAPAMEVLANKVDFDGLALYKDVFAATGTPGTAPTTAAALLAAQQKLNEYSTPVTESRNAVINPAATAGLVNGLSGLFNNQQSVSDQYDTGMLNRSTFGLGVKMSQNVNVHTCGTREATTDTVKTTVTEGASTIVLAVDSGRTVTDGDVFTVADVNAVNYHSKQSTGALQQFTVVGDTTAVGTDLTLTVSPAMIASTSNAKQNIDALPQGTAAVIFIGLPSTQYASNLVHHPDAFTLVTADLEMPKGVDFASRQVHEGISLRIVRQYDINNDTIPCRVDVLYGWKTIYPEWACRLVG